jgi:hypothetical protein
MRLAITVPFIRNNPQMRLFTIGSIFKGLSLGKWNGDILIAMHQKNIRFGILDVIDGGNLVKIIVKAKFHVTK